MLEPWAAISERLRRYLTSTTKFGDAFALFNLYY